MNGLRVGLVTPSKSLSTFRSTKDYITVRHRKARYNFQFSTRAHLVELVKVRLHAQRNEHPHTFCCLLLPRLILWTRSTPSAPSVPPRFLLVLFRSPATTPAPAGPLLAADDPVATRLAVAADPATEIPLPSNAGDNTDTELAVDKLAPKGGAEASLELVTESPSEVSVLVTEPASVRSSSPLIRPPLTATGRRSFDSPLAVRSTGAVSVFIPSRS